MDYITADQELRKLHAKDLKSSRQYFTARTEFGETDWELTVHLLSRIQADIKYRKASREKQVDMLLADCDPEEYDEIAEVVHKWKTQRHRYKAIEQGIACIRSRISAIQSLLRYAREND